MSTTVSFASHLTGDPELLHSHDGKPFVACRVVVNRPIQNEAGEWIDGEPVDRSLMLCGTAANHLYESVDRGRGRGRGGRGVGHGQPCGESWRAGETGGKRTKQVVTFGNRFGEWLFLKYGVACRVRSTAPAAATEN